MLSIWLPTFSTDLARRRLGRHDARDDARRGTAAGRTSHRRGAARCPHAIVLTRQVASRELVARRCAMAAGAGIAMEMDMAHARSLLPARTLLHVEAHRPERDHESLRALACWALRFSPLVAPDPPDGLVIDIAGTERVHGGEARILRAVTASMRGLGLAVRVAVASTWACAWGMARFGEHAMVRVPPGDERTAVEHLPVAALRVDAATTEGLGAIGVTTIGHVLALPRASLASRFEPSLPERIDALLGDAIECLEPVRPTPPIRAERLFDGPTDRWESVETAARQVLDELASELARRERGVRCLVMELRRPRSASESIEIVLARPSRSARHLWSLVRSRLERVDLGEGVEGVTLVAARTARLRHRQESSRALGAADEAVAAGAWGELVDTLVERLGAECVVRIETVESHLPERAFRERRIATPPLGAARAGTRRGADGVDGAWPVPRVPVATTREPALAGRMPGRPTILLGSPEPAQVVALTPDGPVLALRWRGTTSRIVSCTAPERIAPEWWRCGARGERAALPPDRDYFAVQAETGRWLWVCRQVGTTRWFVHGLWS